VYVGFHVLHQHYMRNQHRCLHVKMIDLRQKTLTSSMAIGPPTLTCFNYMLQWYYLLRGRGIIGNQPTYCHQLHELITKKTQNKQNKLLIIEIAHKIISLVIHTEMAIRSIMVE